MKFARRFIILIGLLMLINLTMGFAADKPVKETPIAFFPLDRYNFKSALEGEEIIHDFIIQNKGKATLFIEKVKTG